jgi:aspartyl-tRNA(Asn)/glutamyl-tRNA(Gln) amidotransferase subunit B
MAVLDTFIGLEVHIHLLTKSKAFCSCPSEYGAPPNTHICPVCLGYPGVLPSVNREALKFSYIVGRALNCTLSQKTTFERKNYFYPDMAKNYQISQFSEPVGTGGWFEFETGSKVKRVRIHDIHLEEDAGKMIHEGERTLIDYNRAGTSLLEIVTEPDFSSGEEAEDFLQAFRRLVRYLGVCDGNMEEGSLRCDANISVNRKGKGLGTKVEIKNMNSSRNVRKAMRYEYMRQARAMKNGSPVIQETRLWDDSKQRSYSMRTKETAHDYRYFPEPDIPPFIPDQVFCDEVEMGGCELPLDRKRRFADKFKLPDDLADYLCEEKGRADFFEQLIEKNNLSPAECAKWLKGEVAKSLTKRGLLLGSSPLTPERLQRILRDLQEGSIHAAIAREVIEGVLDEDLEPEQVLERRNLFPDKVDEHKLEQIITNVVDQNAKAAAQVRSGDQKVIGFFVGQVMKEVGASADPKRVREFLERILSE